MCHEFYLALLDVTAVIFFSREYQVQATLAAETQPFDTYLFSFSSEELVYILDSLLRMYLFSSPPQSPLTPKKHCCLTADMGQQLVRAAVQVHSKLGAMFLATPERLHYRFTLKDLTAVFRCVQR